MLSVWHKGGNGLVPVEICAIDAALAEAIWIDVASPTETETSAVQTATGLHVATMQELEEIETSSRLSERDGSLYLSLPWVTHGPGATLVGSPIGFALTKERLLTVRFAPILLIDSFTERLRHERPQPSTGMHVLIGLLETMVDGIADRLERLHTDLDIVSRHIFKPEANRRGGPSRMSAELRTNLAAVGRSGETISGIRDTLLALGRLALFIGRVGGSWIPPDLRARHKTLRQDVVSLIDFDTHLSDKVQFLLDAILGFINIEQSNIIKLMTVVGVVGVPPTLIASIYGMNFESMPELHLPHAYPVALLAILLSAVIPVLWFRRRGWL
jgi:magnesium transporter